MKRNQHNKHHYDSNYEHIKSFKHQNMLKLSYPMTASKNGSQHYFVQEKESMLIVLSVYPSEFSHIAIHRHRLVHDSPASRHLHLCMQTGRALQPQLSSSLHALLASGSSDQKGLSNASCNKHAVTRSFSDVADHFCLFYSIPL